MSENLVTNTNKYKQVNEKDNYQLINVVLSLRCSSHSVILSTLACKLEVRGSIPGWAEILQAISALRYINPRELRGWWSPKTDSEVLENWVGWGVGILQ